MRVGSLYQLRRNRWRHLPVGPWSGAFDPMSLFANGEHGFYFDFSKTDRLFQESTALTPVSADTHPTGMALEAHKWGGGTLAQEIAQQPELFDAAVAQASAGGVNESYDPVTGYYIVSRDDTVSGNVTIAPSVVLGKTYRVSYTKAPLGTGTNHRMDIRIGGNPILADSVHFTAEVDSVRYFRAHVSGPLTINGGPAPGYSWAAKNISVKEIRSNTGIQATTSARPFWKTGGFLRFDGVDDTLATVAYPGAAGSIAIYGKVTSAAKALISCGTTNNDRAEMVTNASGRLGGNAGLLNSNTLFGGPSILGVKGVNIMTWDNATGVVNLYRDGASVYSGLYTGAVSLVNPFNVGSRSGTQLYADMDLYQALTINRVLSPDEALNLSNYWNAQ